MRVLNFLTPLKMFFVFNFFGIFRNALTFIVFSLGNIFSFILFFFYNLIISFKVVDHIRIVPMVLPTLFAQKKFIPFAKNKTNSNTLLKDTGSSHLIVYPTPINLNYL